jgi:hypothetical protein
MRGFARAAGRRLACIVRAHIMRGAAAIHLATAFAFAALVVYLLMSGGGGLGLLVLALASGAFLVLARGLFAGRLRASRVAFAVSSFFAVGFSLVPLYSYVQGGWAEVSALWRILGPFVAVAVAHALAIVFLAGSKPSAP